MKKLTSMIIVITIALSTIANIAVFASEEQAPEIMLADANPEFLEYTNSPSEFNIVPSPVRITAENTEFALVGDSNLSSRYDSRETAIVPAVRDQGKDGNCWAYSSLGSLEITRDNTQADMDFSEHHMGQTLGNNPSDNWTFDYEAGTGGTNMMAAAYLARWSGPVLEKDASCGETLAGTSEPIAKHVQNMQFIPQPNRNAYLTSDFAFRQRIKEKIEESGSVATSYGHYDEAYNEKTFAYYYTGGNKVSHSISIIGWDDSFSVSNFNTAPDDNGAWICRNSWSESFGDNGYFYVSYFDKLIGTDATVYPDPESTSNYDNIYQHDPLGMESSVTYGTEEIWMSNRYAAASKNEVLKAISTYTVTENTTCYVYVDTNSDDGAIEDFKDNQFAAVATYATPGYYTIELDKPVKITGSYFTVAVRIVTTSNAKAPLEKPIKNFSSKAKANSGESFIRYKHTAWVDMTTQAANTNVCLKAFTTQGAEFDCEIVGNKVSATRVSVTFSKTENSTADTAYIVVASGKTAIMCNDVQIIQVTLTTEGDVAYFDIPEGLTMVKCMMFADPDCMNPLAMKSQFTL